MMPSWVPTKCGDGKRSGDGGAEYPCVRRLRHRRLIAFLWLYGFQATTDSMLDESDAICSPVRLQQLVRRQQWRDARSYLCRFLPPLPPVGTTHKQPLSVEAYVLHHFLRVHTLLAGIVAGGIKEAPPVYGQYLSHDRTMSHGAIRIRSIILSILHAHQQVRTSIDWECVGDKAAEIIRDLVYRTPELKDLIYMPCGLIKPYNVLPIGFGLPAISKPSQRSSYELTVSKAMDWVADIVDECLKAGSRPESHPVHPLQTSGMEAVTVAPVLQTTSSSLTCPAINPGTPSMAATQGSSLTSHVPTSGAPFLGTMCTSVPQTALGSLTSYSGKSGIGSMANAGAIAAPISCTMFGSLARPDTNPGMSSVANTGKLGSHVPTPGAPFLGNTCPPILQSVFGNFTIESTYGNSGAGLIANSGPLAPVSQTMSLTNHAEISGAVAAPVLQTMSCSLERPINPGMPLMANAGKWASHMLTPGTPFLGNMGASLSHTGVDSLPNHCENSDITLIANTGSTVSPVSQTTNLTSHSGDSSAIVAPVSQNILSTLTDPSKTLEVTSVANAGQPESLALTPGAPNLLKNLVAMFNARASRNLVGSSTSATKSSELSLMKNNAGAPVALAVQTTNFASHAESSDINKNSDQEGCNVPNQGFRKENSSAASPMPPIQT